MDYTHTQKPPVVIIDDDPLNLMTLSLCIESAGYETICCEGGVEGIGYLRKNSDIHLLFLDLMMPDVDGFEVLNHVKQNPLLTSIPVVIQTGVSNPELLQKAMNEGASGYLLKPYSNKEVMHILSSFPKH